MSHTSRNFVIAYALLVGLPLLGLAGVLRTGRSLAAPISVDGSWKLQADASQPAAQPCGAAISSVLNSALDISQSGNRVEIISDGSVKASGWGAIERQKLQGILIPADTSVSACGNAQQIRLTATVNSQTKPRSLAGVISVDACPSCAELKFAAVLLPRTRGGEAH